jgi:TolA-binding protein
MVLRLADMYMQVAFADPSADQDWYERAIRLYQGLLRNHPDFARLDQVLFMLGRALAAVGRHDEATAAYEELARRFPTSQYTPDAGAGR